jgi:hypothetical protein
MPERDLLLDRSAGCPFYGVTLVVLDTPALVPSRGNQCALITEAHAPCAMEICGEIPEWRECLRNPAKNGSYFAERFAELSAPPALPLSSADAPAPDTPETVAEKMREAREFAQRLAAALTPHASGQCGTVLESPEGHGTE